MKRIKVGIAFISMFGLILGTASIANAVPKYKVPQVKTFHSTKSTHHQNKGQTPKLTVHKSAKSTKTLKSVKQLKD
ncbi:hypothetical protein [Desulfosporosinus sp. SB140]|uniref:hypothetical protein n=1 Tax=Desulfosporosinus paludis TaxID=3115649 RepID=UPI0038906378